mmetsp:Transcript_2779/g.7014  ORF Transcript_2779/g.7014 Transcript_2779/m.7014 type:complete len:174 (-) Transcript_2779:29-550(-)
MQPTPRMRLRAVAKLPYTRQPRIWSRRAVSPTLRALRTVTAAPIRARVLTMPMPSPNGTPQTQAGMLSLSQAAQLHEKHNRAVLALPVLPLRARAYAAHTAPTQRPVMRTTTSPPSAAIVTAAGGASSMLTTASAPSEPIVSDAGGDSGRGGGSSAATDAAGAGAGAGAGAAG